MTDENDNQTTNTYRYDANGNMSCRIEGGETFLQAYNAENRMSGVLLVSGDCDTLGDTLKAWQFTYDGDGVKVKQEYTDSNGTLTTYYYAGGAYEVQTDGSSETVRQYYSLAGVTTGMREGSTFYYFLTDHLGSVVGVTDSTGTLVSETRYLPFGEVRIDVGNVSQTDYGYTFQRNDSYIKLLDYRFRSYSPELGRFVSPDSIVPNLSNPQSLNRYSYVNNRPINFNDPTGHCISGAVADTVFCVFVAAMVIGAIADGTENAISQYKDTGSIDWNEVTGNVLEGAVIAGAPFMALLAAPEVLAATGYSTWSIGQAFNSNGLMSTGIKAFSASNQINNFFYGPPLPKLIIDPKKMPNIAKNIKNAQANGAPSILTRTTDKATINANRAAACSGFLGCGSPDEYPFASTLEGGSGAFVSGVPLAEQRIQGGVINRFYRQAGILNGGKFRVLFEK